MTVHRVGPPPEEAPPHRTELGRVLVTIDDLDALKTFLTRSVAGMAANIRIEFDGGYFTEPEDLRTLSDAEMESLRLKTPKVQVVLNPSAAFAIGDRQEAEEVYRRWARARQTRIKSRPRPLSSPIPLRFVVVFSLLLGISIDNIQGFGLFSFFVSGLLLLTAVFIWYMVGRYNRYYRLSSYAVIIPLSLAEHRQSLASQMYPRRTWIVAIVAIIVTAAVTIGIFIAGNVFLQ